MRRAAELRWLGSAALKIVAHPTVWFTAIRQLFVVATPRWWVHAPFLPIPDRDYLRFRIQTMYGDPDRRPDPDDVLRYLTWCRSWPRKVGV